MNKIFNRVVAAAAAILGLGIIAVKTAPQNPLPLSEKPLPQTAIIIKDEAMEALDEANRLNNQPKKH